MCLCAVALKGDPTPDLNTELAAFIATQPLLEVKP